ncbi:MAG: hypothetical protein AAF736_18135 [Pseudomonadota bacterium]
MKLDVLKIMLALLLSLGLLGLAAGQADDADDGSETTEEANDPATAFDPAVCQEPPEEGETLPSECAELAGEGPTNDVDQGEMRATMRRFVPSEQISEDSSVAFPNDI